jgi:hypothetical protein
MRLIGRLGHVSLRIDRKYLQTHDPVADETHSQLNRIAGRLLGAIRRLRASEWAIQCQQNTRYESVFHFSSRIE